MQATGAVVVAFLLAVCVDLPWIYGAPISHESIRDDVAVMKRFGSFGGSFGYGNGGWSDGAQRGYKFGNTDGTGQFGTDQNDRWSDGAQRGYKSGNTDVWRQFGIVSNGPWGGSLSGSHIFNNGKNRLKGSLGYQHGGKANARVRYSQAYIK